ncbi:MAG: phytoene desaturase family protein [Chloroflexota bacterium]
MAVSSTPPILIVGAGIGGLSAAIRLAAAGKQVIVYEKNSQVGGKMGQVTHDGFRWDTGPSVITMRHVLDDLFASAGRSLDDYLTLQPVEPLTRYFYPDGLVLDISRDWPRLAQQIAALDERDVAGYLTYLAYAARIHDITGPIFIYDEPPTPRSFLRVPLNQWLKADPLRTMQQAIESHVYSPHLRQLLGRFATYVGGSPYEAPATLNVIAHVELTGGVWYPRGGIYAIAEALGRLATELGVVIQTDRPVKQILVENGRITGIELAGGEQIAAAAVVANVDVATTYERLLPHTAVSRRRLQKLNQQEPSCSGFVMLLGVETSDLPAYAPQLVHHNIFFSRNYEREFEQIFKQGRPPDDPTIYLAITGKSDPQDAPPGCENWFVLVNAPALDERYDWAANKLAYGEQILAKLAEWGLGVNGRIRHQTIFTPHDLARQTGAWRGALYGASANSRWTAFRRPHNRCPDYRGLYFAGGTTHPGGGVPMVTLSGKVAAQLLLDDEGADSGG